MNIVVMDLEDKVQHQAMFLFASRDLTYLVQESVYDEFMDTDNAAQRMQLADMVFDNSVRTIIKCRYF